MLPQNWGLGGQSLPTKERRDRNRGNFRGLDSRRVSDAGFGAEGGRAEASEALDGAGADSCVVIGEPEAFAGAHGLVVGGEDEAIFVVHFVVTHDGHHFGIAFLAQQPSIASRFIVRHQGKNRFAFVLFAFFAVPLHRAAPAYIGSADRKVWIHFMELTEFDDARVFFFKGFDGDFGSAFFSAFEGEVVGGAL